MGDPEIDPHAARRHTAEPLGELEQRLRQAGGHALERERREPVAALGEPIVRVGEQVRDEPRACERDALDVSRRCAEHANRRERLCALRGSLGGERQAPEDRAGLEQPGADQATIRTDAHEASGAGHHDDRASVCPLGPADAVAALVGPPCERGHDPCHRRRIEPIERGRAGTARILDAPAPGSFMVTRTPRRSPCPVPPFRRAH